MGRLARLFSKPVVRNSALDGFVDSLLQTFENSRPGLTGEMLQEGEVEAFFRDLYENEVRSLRDKIEHLGHLSAEEREELFQRVDDRIRRVVLPAYSRLTSGFTTRERNDFYLAPESAARRRAARLGSRGRRARRLRRGGALHPALVEGVGAGLRHRRTRLPDAPPLLRAAALPAPS